MQKLTQSPLLAVAIVLLAGSAYAQAPTNTYQGNAIHPVSTPDVTDYAPNPTVKGASAGTYSKDYNDYSQDSYVNQAGGGNYAKVDQTDSRTYSRDNGAGSTAVLIQTGNRNNATQRQTITDMGVEQVGDGTARNFMKSTQNGNASQTDQTQDGGKYNVMKVTQDAGTTNNRAIQSQTEYTNKGSEFNSFNQATITQAGSGNRAEQAQAGLYETGRIVQASANNYAKQTQQGFYNDADIVQGAFGTNNTAIQTQTRSTVYNYNAYGSGARIRQGVNSAASNNYAVQNQTGLTNQADINQRSSNNYARQDQAGTDDGTYFYYPNNISVITQSNVASAAHTVQSGYSNTVIVTQH